jgi:hypothetical protein
MAVPDTSLEFVDGVGVSAKSVHGQTFHGKSLDDLYQHTQDKIQYIKGQGYNVVEMWECQWLASIKRDPELSRFIEHRKRPCDTSAKVK